MTKEIKITVPDGYEIDKANSTFECIKFKKKALSYEDIEVHITKQKIRGIFSAVIEESRTQSDIVGYTTLGKGYCYPEHLRQLLALNKLMNVAEYLNKGWKPNLKRFDYKHYFAYNGVDDTIEIWTMNAANLSGGVVFRTKELAKQAIEILGEDTIKCALGVK